MFRPVSAIALTLASASCAGNSEGGIVIFDREYTVETIATDSEGIGSPDGVIWHEGRLYIADEGGSAIHRRDAGGWKTLADSRSGIMSPEDIVVGSDGAVFFTDDSAGGVWEVREGRATRVAPLQVGDAPTEGLAIGLGGELLVGNTRKRGVDIIGPKSRPFSEALGQTTITKPESIAVGPTGTVWVADNEDDVIYRFDPGARRPTKLSWRGVSPESIALAGTALWMTDSHNGKVYRLKDGDRLQTVAVFAGKLSNVSGIAGGPAGAAYVSVQTDLDADEGTIVALRRRN